MLLTLSRNMSDRWKMYKHLLILVSLRTLFISVNAGEFYTSEDGNSFYVETEKMFSWYDAIYECASRNMILITPETAKKHSEITKLLLSLNFDRSLWTSGLETVNLQFMWTTTGNNVTYTKWQAREPTRYGYTTQCIEYYRDGWRSVKCISPRYIMCVENPIVKKKTSELDALKTQQSAELHKMKSYYENETTVKQEELKQSFRNETQELTKVHLEELHALKNEMKSYCENETYSKLEELKKLHENDRNRLLDEKHRETSVLKTDFDNQLNKLALANKIQENEMLKRVHAKELNLQEQKHNYCENVTNSKLEDLNKLHENYRNNLLDEMHREISVLKTDFEKQLNQLTLANKIQEIEMLKIFHAKELSLQEEKYNYALNSLKNSCGISSNRTKQNEQ